MQGAIERAMADPRTSDLSGTEGREQTHMAPEETRTSPPADPADEVRAFYDSHPYPVPIDSLDRHRDLYRNPDRRRAVSLVLWPTEKQRPNREILVAGCGTSQAAIHALREPDTHVTAIDISETSLRHTRDLQQKYGLRNLDLHRLAIERVEELGRKFDQIVCTGVLHHLPDPDIGLRALRGVLASDGAMHLMVYAAYGRAGIYMMQEYCRLLGIDASEGELRDLGTTIGALSADHPIAGTRLTTDQFLALEHILVRADNRAHEEAEQYFAKRRMHRKIGIHTPHLISVPLLIAQSDMVVMLPRFLAQHLVELYPNIKIMTPEIGLPSVDVKQYWHRRFHTDSANKWLRSLVAQTFQRAGTRGTAATASRPDDLPTDRQR